MELDYQKIIAFCPEVPTAIEPSEIFEAEQKIGCALPSDIKDFFIRFGRDTIWLNPGLMLDTQEGRNQVRAIVDLNTAVKDFIYWEWEREMLEGEVEIPSCMLPILTADIDIYCKLSDEDYGSIYVYACDGDYFEKVASSIRELLAIIYVFDPYKTPTPLYDVFMSRGEAAAVEYLLEHPEAAQERNHKNLSQDIIWESIYLRAQKLFLALQEAGADFVTKNPFYESNALDLVVGPDPNGSWSDDTRIWFLDRLMAMPFDLNAVNRIGQTPLVAAETNCSPRVVEHFKDLIALRERKNLK